MRAGKLDRTITLQRLTRTVSEAGTVTEAWMDLATVRAELLALTTSETEHAFGEDESARLGFRIRYLADVTTADRVSYEGNDFNLVAMVEIGRRRGLELQCEGRPI